MKLKLYTSIVALIIVGIVLICNFTSVISLMPVDKQSKSYFKNSPMATRTDGIDVSHYQGTITWSSVYGAGYRWAIAKATEGTTYTDAMFTTNMANARAAGLYIGGYHFAHPDTNNATAEANQFLSVAGSYFTDGYLLPALDLEQGSSIGKTKMSAWVNEWMGVVKAFIKTHSGIDIEPIIYTSSSYAGSVLDSSILQYHLWIANWGVTTPNTGIWPSWDFWQYSSTGTVPGISGNMDLDYYNGNVTTLQQNFTFAGLSVPINFTPVLIFTVFVVMLVLTPTVHSQRKKSCK